VHVFTWEDFIARFGWNDRRRRLLTGLKSALGALKVAGCAWANIDGSFVMAKEEPGDFDACWDMTGVDPYRLDPVLLTFDPGRLTQKIKYGGELFPAQVTADGVSGKTYLEFFQIDKETGKTKGIVAIDLRRLP
jgi:hypothetical protein